MTLIVLDQFYNDPGAVRACGIRGQHDDPTPLLDRLGDVVDRKLQLRPNERPLFRCEVTGMERERDYDVHADPCDWIAIVYLTPDHPEVEGTGLFAYQGQVRTHLEPSGASFADYRAFALDVGKRRDQWEQIDSVAFRYNRLALFPGRHWHAAGPPFGYDAQDGRLIQLLALNEVA